MPLDDGVRFDDDEHRLPFRPEPGEQQPNWPISGREVRLWALSLKHGDLMPQRQDLQLSCGARLKVNAERGQ